VDVGGDGECRYTESLHHDDAGGLVPHPRQLLQRLDVGGDSAAVALDEDPRERVDGLGLARCQPARADDGVDALHIQRGHGLGAVRQGKERRRRLVDPHIRTLRAEQHGDQQRVRVLVIQWNGRIGEKLVQAPADVERAFLEGHRRQR